MTSSEDRLSVNGKVFVLLHGAFHGAWVFERLTPLLVQEGHHVVARDMPGHGLRARFPRSYFQRPLDLETFSTEPSPLAQLRLQDYADEVVAIISRLASRMPEREIILVGHSFAGLVLNPVGEAIPQLIGRLVYLSAWMTANGRPANDYYALPEFATTKVPSIVIGDPSATGALRIDPRSADPSYQARLKEVFAPDIDDEEWEVVANLLTPDVPARPFAETVTITIERWGTVPRTYISCLDDHAGSVAAQHVFVRDADKLTPDNPTDVRDMSTGHSPFLSQPEQLGSILLDC